jgi:hypothetical protein
MKAKFILKLFIAFLKKNDVLEEYVKNLVCDKGGKYESIRFIVSCCNYQPSNLLMHAFVWREFILRNKGLKWGDLHRKWNLLLNSKLMLWK